MGVLKENKVMRKIVIILTFLAISFSSSAQTPYRFLLRPSSDLTCGNFTGGGHYEFRSENITIQEVRDVSNNIITKDCNNVYSIRPSKIVLRYHCSYRYCHGSPCSDGNASEGGFSRLETITIPNNVNTGNYSVNGLSVNFTAYLALEKPIDNSDCGFTLNSNSNIDISDYVWQYETDSSSWSNLPSTYNGNPSITITGDDIGVSPGVIRFRLISCGGASTSNIVSYTIISCSPQLLPNGFHPKNNSCSYNSDGDFSMDLDRDLNGKRLVVSLFSENLNKPDEYFFYKQDDTFDLTDNLDGSYTYHWPELEMGKNLDSGTYRVLYQTYEETEDFPEQPVWDSLEATEPFIIGSPDPISFSVPETHIKDVSCNGDSDATIQVHASGGVGNYKYRLNGGSTIPFSNTAKNASHLVTNLLAGKIEIKVQDGNGCTERE